MRKSSGLIKRAALKSKCLLPLLAVATENYLSYFLVAIFIRPVRGYQISHTILSQVMRMEIQREPRNPATGLLGGI